MDKIELPKYKISLSITHNEHKIYYETIEDYINQNPDCPINFESEEIKQECIKTDSLWEMRWYPETPISFYMIGAPTLEGLLDYAKKVKA